MDQNSKATIAPPAMRLLDPVNPRVEPADVAYLMKLTDALNTTLDLQTLLNRTSELVRAVIHYRIFAIFLSERPHPRTAHAIPDWPHAGG